MLVQDAGSSTGSLFIAHQLTGAGAGAGAGNGAAGAGGAGAAGVPDPGANTFPIAPLMDPVLREDF